MTDEVSADGLSVLLWRISRGAGAEMARSKRRKKCNYYVWLSDVLWE
jgi:hypothetical protein